jgi:general secretion pathway protein J
LDRTLTTEPVAVELLDQVRALKFRFLDRNRDWSEQWPAVNLQGGTSTAGAPQSPTSSQPPIAIEVTLELEDWGTLVRLIEVPG